MRSTVLALLLLAIVSRSLSAEQVRQSSPDRPSFTVVDKDLHKSSVKGERIKRLRIRDQTGLDGKVRGIRLDSEEDKPGIYAYGLSKKRLQDNGIIERAHVADGQAGGSPRNSRLVEAYGMPKDNAESNGFIQRRQLPSVLTEEERLSASGSENEEIRKRRSVRQESGNKVEETAASEAEDMEAQDSKVFRPLFVHRQQVARRQSRRHNEHGKNSHLYRRRHICDHRPVY